MYHRGLCWIVCMAERGFELSHTYEKEPLHPLDWTSLKLKLSSPRPDAGPELNILETSLFPEFPQCSLLMLSPACRPAPGGTQTSRTSCRSNTSLSNRTRSDWSTGGRVLLVG